MQSPTVYPAFTQHDLELLAEGHVNGFFGWQQVAVWYWFLALYWWAQSCCSLLEDIGTHVLHNGTHDDHADDDSESMYISINVIIIKEGD